MSSKKSRGARLSSSFLKKRKRQGTVLNNNGIYSYTSDYSKTILARDHEPEGNNYVRENKRNLNNFFADRLPIDHVPIHNPSKEVSNEEISELRRKQLSHKNKIQISLSNSFQLQESKSKTQIKKIDQTFSLHDKNLQLKEKYGGQKRKMTFYSSGSHQNATEASMRKKVKILKREMYESVFGKDQSLVLVQQPRNRYFKPQQKNQKPREKEPKQITQEERTKFNTLLKRIAGRAVEFKPNHFVIKEAHSEIMKKKTISKDSLEQEKQLETNIIGWVQNVTEQQRKGLVGDRKLKKLEDLSQTDSKFYEAMKKHKEHRLKYRQRGLESPPQFENEQEREKSFFELLHSDEDEASFMITATERMKLRVKNEPAESHAHLALQERLKVFIRNLMQVNHVAFMFGIGKKDLYLALWRKYTAFEVEGSYLFFRAIKDRDASIVRDFVERDREFLYQFDKEGRSALIYACIYEHLPIVDYIASMGVNIEHKCNQGKNALHYALSVDNAAIVKVLLQKGASPWSSQGCSYDLADNSRECRTLMKNARKVRLAHGLMRTIKEKNEFWAQNRGRIREDELIQFD